MDLREYLRGQNVGQLVSKDSGYVYNLYDLKTEAIEKELRDRFKERVAYRKHRKSKRKEKDKMAISFRKEMSMYFCNYKDPCINESKKFMSGYKKYRHYKDLENISHVLKKKEVVKKIRTQDKQILAKINKIDFIEEDKIHNLQPHFLAKDKTLYIY